MKNKNIRLAVITATIYLAGITAALSIIAWISSVLNAGGFSTYLNAEYGVGIVLGLAISFIAGYFYHPLLSTSIAEFRHANPDIPMKYAEGVCKSKLLCLYFGYAAVATLVAATAIFVFSGESYIEAICLLLSIGFTSLLLWLQFRFRSRDIMRSRFRSMHI